jgi:hypothetical protein
MVSQTPATISSPPATVKAVNGSCRTVTPSSAPTTGWTLRKIAARGAGTRRSATFQTRMPAPVITAPR